MSLMSVFRHTCVVCVPSENKTMFLMENISHFSRRKIFFAVKLSYHYMAYERVSFSLLGGSMEGLLYWELDLGYDQIKYH